MIADGPIEDTATRLAPADDIPQERYTNSIAMKDGHGMTEGRAGASVSLWGEG